MRDLRSLRETYRRDGLDEADAPTTPWPLFETWFDQASGHDGLPEPNAMVLSTVDATGRPHARTVLLKDLAEGEGGGAGASDPTPVFYTNHRSDKGEQLGVNPHCALLFLWLPLERQVRIEGRARMLDDAASDAYFAERPRASQLGAWASPQSHVVSERADLERRYQAVEDQYDGHDVPRPPHWGGWRVEVDVVEFWQGREGRLHDRLRYRRGPDGAWLRERLGP